MLLRTSPGLKENGLGDESMNTLNIPILSALRVFVTGKTPNTAITDLK
jgi:hypothetical protein